MTVIMAAWNVVAREQQNPYRAETRVGNLDPVVDFSTAAAIDRGAVPGLGRHVAAHRASPDY